MTLQTKWNITSSLPILINSQKNLLLHLHPKHSRKYLLFGRRRSSLLIFEAPFSSSSSLCILACFSWSQQFIFTRLDTLERIFNRLAVKLALLFVSVINHVYRRMYHLCGKDGLGSVQDTFLLNPSIKQDKISKRKRNHR